MEERIRKEHQLSVKTLSLAKLKPNQSATVTSINVTGPARRRLIDMGFTPGAKVVMKKLAPFGDPIEINLRGYELSIRKQDASQVLVAIDEFI